MKKVLILTTCVLIFFAAPQIISAQSPARGNYVPADLDTMAHPFVDHFRFGGNYFRGRLIENTSDGWQVEIFFPEKTEVHTFPASRNNLAEKYQNPGQRIILKEITGRDDVYLISKPDRILRYITLTILCLVICVVIGGWPTLRGLTCVIIGVLFFIFWTLPRIQTGSSVLIEICFFYLLMAVFVLPSSLGLNRKALSAVLAALSTGVISVFLLLAITSWIPTTALYDEAVRALDYAVRYLPEQVAHLSLQSLIIGATLIGALGVVLDVTIDVTASASEIASARPELPFKDLLARAMTVCRRLVGTMTNTLLLAYAGSDMLLLFSLYLLPEKHLITFNRDLVAVEIIRALGGAIGFLAAVPLSVGFFSLLCRKKIKKPAPPTGG